MEKEDPIERIERERAEKKDNKGLRTTMWVLVALAVVLAGTLAYVWITHSKLVDELTQDKKDLTEQIEALQQDYENLSTEYDNINLQLDSSREEVAQLVERIRTTEATNRSKMRQYEKELGTLRSIMRNYIVQIDSLNNLNHKLTADAAKARKEAAQRKKENEELAEQVESLTGQVAVGSIIKARAVKVEAFNAADKVVDKSNKVVRLIVSLSLIENQLAPKGPVRVYVKIKGPDGQYIPAGEASREVDYEGSEVDMSIYINNIGTYVKGIYTAEVYSDATSLGSAEVLLR